MWDKITKQLSKYESAVLTGRDAQGHPFSVRCMPQVDIHAHVLRVQLPPSVLLQPGPASLLCHRHNALLWDMESFLLRGNLVQVELATSSSISPIDTDRLKHYGNSSPAAKE